MGPLVYTSLPQQYLNFLPEPQGHGSLRPTLVGVRAGLVDDPDGSGIDLLRSLSPRVGGDRGAGWRIWSNNRAGNLPARQRSAFNRDSPDESQTGINVRVFPALLQDRREVLTATSTSGNPNAWSRV